MYSAYGLLQPASDFTLDEAKTRLLAQFPGATANLAGDTLRVTVGSWDMNLRLNAGTEVVTESIGFAGRVPGLTDSTRVEACDRRVEAWSDTADPFLEHFDKYQRVLAVLKSFTGLTAIDPKDSALL